MLLMPRPCRADDLLDIRVARLPAEDFLCLLARRDELGRVAGAACAHLDLDVLARGLFRGLDHLFDREALAVAEVEDVALAAPPQVLEREDVRIGEVDDVDVVAQARAVRRRIVVAKDGDVVALAKGHLEDQRDEVRLGMMVFADGAVIECAGGVEIAQRHVADAVGTADPLHHLFHRALRLAVRVRRVRLVILHDGDALRLAVDGSRRGKDDLVDVMAHHGLEEHLHAIDVVVEILQRLFHALADEGVRRKVDDSLNLVLIENTIEHRRVADVALVELRFRVQRPAMAGLEVVDDDDVLAFRHELMNRMGTDVAGTAANEN